MSIYRQRMDECWESSQNCEEVRTEAIYATAAGLFAIADAIDDAIGVGLRLLGNGNAFTSMGAIEALAKVHQEGFAALAAAIIESKGD